MEDQRIQIWNMFHDGEITAVSRAQRGTIRLFISIPYLRRRLEPLGDSFVVTLSGLTRVEFQDFAGVPSSLKDEIEIGEPTILSTESESMPILIETTMGRLTLDFESIAFSLDTGQSVSFEVIEKVFIDYWTEWEAKGKQPSPRN